MVTPVMEDSSNESADHHKTQTRRALRGVRGATTTTGLSADDILDATRELLSEILERNKATKADVISAFFTATPDLRTEFPARAARELGWDDVAMLCGVEMDVSNSPQRCIRVLLHMTLPGDRSDVQHVYLRDAEGLRPNW